MIGAPLAGWLTGVPLFGLAGWQVLFLVEAVPALSCSASIVVFWMADWPARGPLADRAGERSFLTAQYEREVARQVATRRYTVLEALKDREVLKLCLTYFLWITGFWGFSYWMPTVLKDVVGLVELAIGQAVRGRHAGLAAGVRSTPGTRPRSGTRSAGTARVTCSSRPIGMGAAPSRATRGSCSFLVRWPRSAPTPRCRSGGRTPRTFLSGAAAAGAVGLINSMGTSAASSARTLTGWVRQTTGSFAAALLYLALSLAAAGLLILTLRSAPSVPPA